MVATSQARNRYCPPVLPEHQAMRSCPTWAMGNVLGVQGDKAILGRTGESDHFDHNLVIRDDDMMLLLTITMKMMRMVISNTDANDDEALNNDLVVLGA